MEVKGFFRETFRSVPTHLVQAPGRLELLGNHTDYNEGLVMSLAIDRYIYMAATSRNDGKIELASTAFPERESFWMDRIEKNPATPWADYVKGVLLQLRQRGVHFTGFNGAIHGTIPFGAGLSSSAALEVASALTVRRLFPYILTERGSTAPPLGERPSDRAPMKSAEKMLMAKVCQAAENKFVGVNSGLLDQISSLFGKESHVIEIDCQHNTVKHTPMPGGVAVVVCDSGVKHQLVGGEYNELRKHCESAAKALGVRALRAVDPPLLEQNKSKLSKRDYECAYHIVGENYRVVRGERALRAGDLAQFGEYLFQSHESSRDFFKNSTPELDLLVELARKQKGCIGARLTGGGFGGATINLVEYSEVNGFRQEIAAAYEKQTGWKTEPTVCQIVDGAK